MSPVSSTPGRNDPCSCGSGLRYKQCHGALPGAGTSAVETTRPDTLARQGFEAHQRNDLDTAERHYRAVIAAAPEHAGALHYLGVIMYQRKRIDEAMPLLDRAIALVPDEPEYHNNRGLALAAAQRDGEAIAAHRRTLELKPDHAGAWNNLGLAMQAYGDVAGAIDAFRSGLRLAPGFPQLHWNLSLALLLLGDFAQGWHEYEWRLQCPELYSGHPRYAGPRWAGDDPAGRTLLLTAEQGLGDMLQTLRFAREVADRGARVIVAMHEPLRQLAASVPGVDAAFAENEELPPYDAQVSLMSLPLLLSVTPQTIPSSVPYLRPDPLRRDEAAAAIARERDPAVTIGIAWSGSAANATNARRSMSLAMFGPLLDVPGTRWYSLKWEAEVLSATDAPFGDRLISLPLRNEFDGLAALVSELDLVITVDTSLAHLAGALGKPAWVLLHSVPDWRWGLARRDSPWYPTARLFRQRSPGDWSDPLREVDAELRALVARR